MSAADANPEGRGHYSILLVVTHVGGCPVLTVGDRWVIDGHEIRALGRARLCLPGLASLHPSIESLQKTLEHEGPGSLKALPVLRCGDPDCGALFQPEPALERRQRQEPPPSVERRHEHLAMTAGKLLRDSGPFLSRLPVDLAERLTSAGAAHPYTDGELILPEGVVGDSLFLVEGGQVEITKRSRRDGSVTVLALLGPGECFGEMSLLTGEKTSASVSAAGEAVVRSITRRELDALLASSAHLNRAFSELLAARIRAVNVSVESELGRGIMGRLSMMSVSDLVQSFNAQRLSGTLVISGERQEGRMGFEDGRVSSAELGELGGEEAFHAMMGWTEGEFCFESALASVPDPARIDRDTLDLIMESMQRLDESPP